MVSLTISYDGHLTPSTMSDFRTRAEDMNEKRGDFESSCALDRFAPSDGVGATFVSPGDAPSALRDVEAHALCRAESFIPQLPIANVSISNRNEHLASDSENVKPMMRERRCVGHGDESFRPVEGLIAMTNPASPHLIGAKKS